MANDFMGLRGEAEIAVNDLAVACLEAAELHDTGAAASEDPEVAAKLRTLAARRRRASATIGAYLAERYEGPNWPDQEKELLKRAAARMKSMLSPNATASLAADCLAQERRVGDTAEIALSVEIPSAMRACISELRQDAAEQIGWLQVVPGAEQ